VQSALKSRTARQQTPLAEVFTAVQPDDLAVFPVVHRELASVDDVERVVRAPEPIPGGDDRLPGADEHRRDLQRERLDLGIRKRPE
jgi:hypothetical protein